MIHTDSAASETDISATNATGQSVSLLLRIFVLLAIWSAFSVICYMNYQTDACPLEVKHREALLAGVTAPLFLAAHTTAACFHTPYWLKQVFAWGFLIGFVALAIALLRSASRRWFILSAVALIALLCGGTGCLVYANAHAYPKPNTKALSSDAAQLQTTKEQNGCRREGYLSSQQRLGLAVA